MAELYVTLCLLTTNQCHDFKIPGVTAETVEACRAIAQKKVEDWYQSDPKNTEYKVMSTSCRTKK
jgi:hypothetical protein